MLSLGPALVALSLPSRTAHIPLVPAFSPLALLGDAYDGALNSASLARWGWRSQTSPVEARRASR